MGSDISSSQIVEGLEEFLLSLDALPAARGVPRLAHLHEQVRDRVRRVAMHQHGVNQGFLLEELDARQTIAGD